MMKLRLTHSKALSSRDRLLRARIEILGYDSKSPQFETKKIRECLDNILVKVYDEISKE